MVKGTVEIALFVPFNTGYVVLGNMLRSETWKMMQILHTLLITFWTRGHVLVEIVIKLGDHSFQGVNRRHGLEKCLWHLAGEKHSAILMRNRKNKLAHQIVITKSSCLGLRSSFVPSSSLSSVHLLLRLLESDLWMSLDSHLRYKSWPPSPWNMTETSAIKAATAT